MSKAKKILEFLGVEGERWIKGGLHRQEWSEKAKKYEDKFCLIGACRQLGIEDFWLLKELQHDEREGGMGWLSVPDFNDRRRVDWPRVDVLCE